MVYQFILVRDTGYLLYRIFRDRQAADDAQTGHETGVKKNVEDRS